MSHVNARLLLMVTYEHHLACQYISKRSLSDRQREKGLKELGEFSVF